MTELSTRYNPQEIETRLYRFWESGGFFTPEEQKQKQKEKGDSHQMTGGAGLNRLSVAQGETPPKTYVVVIPPPNVTGILHMGHALNNTLQDILVRWHRMKGEPTLWVPGTDHAGIATQNVVEKKLAKEGKKRQDLGREKFIEEVWKWKEEHGSTITQQLRRLGASCDWSRERFTMDEGLSKSVREAFVQLYEKGLIYQGNYIINWCPRCQTALSDEEAPSTETEGKLYYYYYLVKDPQTGKLTQEGAPLIATTRPETMLGDTALAVNPKDKRYKNLDKQEIFLPLQDRPLKVIRDDFVDPEFGTGVVKVTPAHDPNDFEMGIRHKLEQRNILTPDGRINELGKPYEGLDRFEARKRIVEDLKAAGLFEKEVPHRHAVPHCYRCHTVVEPYLSKQWFVKMKPLAEKALKAHQEGKVKITPERWNKVYTNWLENIRDWCISRQIWWGHPIPVKGDPDVLDTWFSSWLWPFSTLGWPEKTEDLKRFYPTSDLVTAPEILFFWVARMIMAGLEFMGEVPFKNVLIHGTVRAQSGLKMSKSLGNAIDPIEVIDEMGADALRQSLVMLASQDVYLNREKFEVGRNFTNKIWNAARFVLMNLEDFKIRLDSLPKGAEESRNFWIIYRLEQAAREISQELSRFNISQAATAVYHFVWGDFCDWFIELAKPNLDKASPERESTQAVLCFVLEKTLRLLHPFMPFISEEIWQKLKERAVDREEWPETLMKAPWPEFKERPGGRKIAFEFEIFQEAVTLIRNLRANLNLLPGKALKAVIRPLSRNATKALPIFQKEIEKLGRLESLEIKKDFKRNQSYVGSAASELEVFLAIEGVVDPEKEKARLEKKIQEIEQYLMSIRKKLENPNFVQNAPEEVVAEERGKLLEQEAFLKTLKEHRELFE